MSISLQQLCAYQADAFEAFCLKSDRDLLDEHLGKMSPNQLRNLALNLTQFAAYLEDYWSKRSECSMCHQKLSSKLMDYSSDLCLKCWGELHNP